ncbi:hypothetical protein pb186bvf_007687 [Paramecium bursaria]
MSYQLVTQNDFYCCQSNKKKYNHNKIRTSKYEWWNFLPKNLFGQLQKPANIFFICIAVLQSIKLISLTNGQPLILIPLIIMMIVSMFKDNKEDQKRKDGDQKENENLTEIEGNQVKWQDLYVGQIIKILNNQFAPADILIVGTSEDNASCFIETKNLDGETNLKQRFTPNEFQSYFSEQQYYFKDISLEYDIPNNYIYSFQGNAYLSGDVYPLLNQKQQLLRNHQNQELEKIDKQLQHFNEKKISLNPNNLILRGCQLKNTKFVYGVVLYSGQFTKIMQNQIKPKIKYSKLENQIALSTLQVFIFQIIICTFTALYYSFWYEINSNELPYLEINRDGGVDDGFAQNFFIRFFNWILIFQSFVPISLIVTLETVKFTQGISIMSDKKCISNDIPCAVQSSNLNEELGQINYIFSDKTGTLTKNYMTFKKICIDGKSYGSMDQSKQIMPLNVDFEDKQFELIKNSNKAHLVLQILSLCHSAIVQVENGETQYNVTSPDELALLNFAKFQQYEYLGIDKNNIISVKINQKIEQFELLYNFEFDSTRKRNSVILKELKSQMIYIFSKGADSIMIKRSINLETQIMKENLYNLNQYSIQGLRCLVLAYRALSLQEFDEFQQNYSNAQKLTVDKERIILELQDQIEQKFEIVGITAIEDKLQDNVDVTIKAFRDADIKVWVLTGDKMETAINIGFSCSLLSDQMAIAQIDTTDENQINSKLIEKFDALAISGDTLTIIEKNQELVKLLVKTTQQCQSVLCCRVSPKQKQEIVMMVRKANPQISCIAIGDGANDVSMITSANVGVGIKGVEGQQAARSADYAIGEFQILRNLLFVHGRECYRRNCLLVLYNFYKNMILVLPTLWQLVNQKNRFSISNAFSGQPILDQTLTPLYNVLYTSIPIFFMCTLDEELSEEVRFNNFNNTSYQIGQKNQNYNTKLFFKWVLNTFAQSVIITYFLIYGLQQSYPQGKDYNFLWTGTAIFGAVVILVNLRVLIMTYTYTLASFLSVGFMISVYFISLAIFSLDVTNDSLYSILDIFQSSKEINISYLLILLTILSIDYGIQKFYEMNTQIDCKIHDQIQDTANKSALELSNIV